MEWGHPLFVDLSKVPTSSNKNGEQNTNHGPTQARVLIGLANERTNARNPIGLSNEAHELDVVAFLFGGLPLSLVTS